MNESIDGGRAEIDALKEPSMGMIPFSLVEKHKNKTTKLLENSGEVQPIEGQNRTYAFSFKEPLFVSHGHIKITGYRDFDTFEVIWETDDGRRIRRRVSPSSNTLQFTVDAFIRKLEFVPPRAWFRSTNLNSVAIFGFRKSDAKKFIDFAYDIDKRKADVLREIDQASEDARQKIAMVAEKEQQLSNLEGQIKDSESKLSSLQTDIGSSTANLSEIQGKIGSSQKEREAIEERISTIRGDVKIETEKRENLQSEISEKTSELQELQRNINLFPTEISGFANQSGSNIDLYLKYAFGPLLILVAMFFLMLSGAVDLTTVISQNDNINLAALIVSRIPYVLVASAIIYTCYRLARLFFTEIMNIKRQQLSLTKISIIAKDVSQAAESELGLSSDEIYEKRLRVKMAMLGDHIKHLIASEPELLFPENLFPIRPVVVDPEEFKDRDKQDTEDE